MSEMSVCVTTSHVAVHTLLAAAAGPQTTVVAEPNAVATPTAPQVAEVSGVAAAAAVPVVQHAQFPAVLTVPTIAASLAMV
jgi:hypothetical protein